MLVVSLITMFPFGAADAATQRRVALHQDNADPVTLSFQGDDGDGF
jgi:hypothetical protein